MMPELAVSRKCLCAAVLLLACSSPEGPLDYTAAPKLAATGETFADFRTWERLPLENAMLPVQAVPGPAFVYVNHRPDPGASRWPVGSVLVKTVEPSEDFRDWTVHAMVKRGALFNPHGSVGWEFFGIQLDEQGRPTILWRSDGHNDGHTYGTGTVAGLLDRDLSCNDCHGASWQSDAVLTPALSLAP